MNTLNSKTNESNRFKYNFSNKLNFKNPNKNMALANLTFDLPDGSYSVSNIQDYFEYIIKKYETIVDNPPVKIYVNKIKHRFVFKIKTSYELELLTEETMQLLGSSKKDIDKNKDGEIEPILEAVEVILVHCNLVNNNYQQASKVFLLLYQISNLVN